MVKRGENGSISLLKIVKKDENAGFFTLDTTHPKIAMALKMHRGAAGVSNPRALITAGGPTHIYKMEVRRRRVGVFCPDTSLGEVSIILEYQQALGPLACARGLRFSHREHPISNLLVESLIVADFLVDC